MINFELGPFWDTVQQLKRDIEYAGILASQNKQTAASEEHHRFFQNTVSRFIDECLKKLEIREADTALWKINGLFQMYWQKQYTYEDMKIALERLLEDAIIVAMGQQFFHYPREMTKLFFSIDVDWSTVIANTGFPSARREIVSGIDCYAFGDYSGCIFHMLRIAETGLRAMAHERGVRTVKRNKPIEYAMWGEVIGAVHGTIDDLRTAKGNTKPLTAKKRENREIAVEFYSTIMGDPLTIEPQPV